MFRPQAMAYARMLRTPPRDVRTGSRSAVVDAILVVAGFFALGYALYVAQFSPAVRWGLGIVAILATGLAAWWAVNRRTETPEPFEAPADAGGTRSGELSSLTLTVRRAARGLPFSQVLVTDRVRESFLDHARLALGLSPEATRRLSADPVALQRTFRDPALADFLFLPSSDPEDRYRWIAEARRGRGFEVSISGILDHMEAWR